MSSIFSSASKPPRSNIERRKRSHSETRDRRRNDKERVPTVLFEDNDDVATAICVEISKSMMLQPDMTTGIFFRTLSNAQRDINKSDATLIMSAAILKHIGNSKMSDKLLAKSSTCSKYYEKLNLHNEVVNELFVTMLFALNPNFATMLNKSMTLSLDRASRMTSDEYSKDQLVSCIKTLASSGVINSNEVVSTSSDILERRVTFDRKNSSLQTTPTEMIHPNDSVSAVGTIPGYRRNINQGDIMKYIDRKRHGKEPEFREVFPSSKVNEPVKSIISKSRRGVGYVTPPDELSKMATMMNNILGSHTKDSYILETGDKRSRRVRVEDFLESESVAESAVAVPKYVDEVSYEYLNKYNTRPPTPTEVTLPDTNYQSSTATDRTIRQKDSIELLMESLRAS